MNRVDNRKTIKAFKLANRLAPVLFALAVAFIASNKLQRTSNLKRKTELNDSQAAEIEAEWGAREQVTGYRRFTALS